VSRNTRAIVAFIATIAVASPLAGRGFPSLFHRAVQSAPDGESFDPPDEPDIFMTEPSAGSQKRDWMRFRTDPCGTLLSMDSGRSTLRRASLDDGDDGDDIGDMDDMDDVDDDPSDLGRALIGRWLSQHPEIAVIGDGVEKSCDDGPYLDEDLPSEIEALSPQPKSNGQRTMPTPIMLIRNTIVRTTGIPAA
jgi:hypothetical protein